MTPAEQALIDAALAYVACDTEPLSRASVERWRALIAAAEKVREERAR